MEIRERYGAGLAGRDGLRRLHAKVTFQCPGR
jgi:hypothetical protein